MQTKQKIARNSLMTLEAYSSYRRENKPLMLAQRKLRRVFLGRFMNVQFESETSIRYQIQEILHIEKIFEEEDVLQEIQAYAPLVPDGSNWKATLMLELPDKDERKRELARLIGVQNRVFVQVQGHAPVYALANEDINREDKAKTSAVHFLRFEFTPALCTLIKAGAAVTLGCDHIHYTAHSSIAAETLASLVSDLC